MFTKNERRVLRYLIAHFNSETSINQIARECQLSPNGAYKILKKFEEEEVLERRKIANVISYKLIIKTSRAQKIVELAFLYKLEGRMRYREQDLKPLQEATQLALVFGSYITKKEQPGDLDVLFIIRKRDYTKYHKLKETVELVLPVKLHDILQTKSDLKENMLKRNPAILNALSEGVVLWGQDFLLGVLKDVI